MRACKMPVFHKYLRLVENNVVGHFFAKHFNHGTGIIGKVVAYFVIQKTAFFKQLAGQIPMINSNPRRNSVFQQFVCQIVVETRALGVDGAGTVGHNTTPTDGKPIVFYTQLVHQCNVLLVSMIVVACNTAAHVAQGFAFRKLFVPNTRASSAFVFRTFDLIRGRGDAPNKILVHFP